MTFDTIMMVDWSGGNDRGATPKKDAIWTCVAGQQPMYHRTRQVAETYIHETLNSTAGRTTVGFDLCFAYPEGFAKALIGSDDPLALWDWFEERVEDGKSKQSLSFGRSNQCEIPRHRPFWFNALKETFRTPAKEANALVMAFEYRSTDEGAFRPGNWPEPGRRRPSHYGVPDAFRPKSFGQDIAVWPFEAQISKSFC